MTETKQEFLILFYNQSEGKGSELEDSLVSFTLDIEDWKHSHMLRIILPLTYISGDQRFINLFFSKFSRFLKAVWSVGAEVTRKKQAGRA